MRISRPLSLMAAVSLGSMVQATAEEAGPGASDYSSIALVVENDVFAGTDRNYTNGLKLAFTSSPVLDDQLTDVAEFISNTLLGRDEGDILRKEIGIGHSIFTPEDRLAREPLPDQHPYAGWLYLEFSALLARPERNIFDTLTLQLGVVGPSAGGEFVQNNFHNLIGDDELRGWDNQLRDEPGLALSFNRKHRFNFVQWGKQDRFGIDFVPSYGATVGNVLTQASLGATFRFGFDLDQTFGPPRVRPALGGAALFESQASIGSYFFIGMEGRAVAQNIFLDGNTWRDSLSVDKEPFVGDLQAGFVFQIYDWLLTWTAVARTKEFETQGELQRFGAVSVVRRF